MSTRRCTRHFMVMMFVLALSLATPGHADQTKFREDACARIIAKLVSVNPSDCRPDSFTTAGYSTQGMPILLKEYPPLAHRLPQARVLLLGGTHGDEYSSISIVFHWMRILDQHHSGLFHWLFLPLLNPDGLFPVRSTRTNARGVDLNRNFPSPGWDVQGVAHWEERTGSNPRYNPGPGPGSEAETAILVEIIGSFQPQAIISVHAPLNLVDYDGPGTPPNGLGSLPLRRLGNYPGTLGHYAGALGNIPVVTVELASASHMPSDAEIGSIWRDLVRWLVNNVPVPGHFGAHVPLMVKEDSEQTMLQGK